MQTARVEFEENTFTIYITSTNSRGNSFIYDYNLNHLELESEWHNYPFDGYKVSSCYKDGEDYFMTITHCWDRQPRRFKLENLNPNIDNLQAFQQRVSAEIMESQRAQQCQDGESKGVENLRL